MVYRTFDTMPITLTVRDIADTLSIGRNAAYNLVNAGTLPSIRIGTQIRVPRDAFIRFLQGNCQSA